MDLLENSYACRIRKQLDEKFWLHPRDVVFHCVCTCSVKNARLRGSAN